MHDLILALLFVAMVVMPAIVATISGKEKKTAKTPAKGRPGLEPVLSEAAAQKTIAWDAPTLPLNRTLGLAGR